MALRFDGTTWTIDELAYVEKVSRTEDPYVHTHRFLELVYILHGKSVHRIDNASYPAGRGDLLLINEGQQHSIACEPGCIYINILIRPEIIAESMKNAGNAFSLLNLKDFSEFQSTIIHRRPLIHFAGSVRTRIETLLDWMLEEQQKPRSGSTLLFRSALNMLLIQIFRTMELPFVPDEQCISSSLLSYLRENCADRITLESIANTCGYDPSYFSRLFHQSTGKTFTAYLQDCRLDKASLLLECTDKPVDLVLQECGFTDRSRFFRMFFSRFNMTPLQFRKSKNQIL